MEHTNDSLDRGPFFHGTKASLQLGELLEPKKESNFEAGRISNYIYFTATLDEPTGPFENDPNLTDKRFPGNPTRSYRSASPLKVVAELGAWERHSEEVIQQMLSHLQQLTEDGKAEIID